MGYKICVIRGDGIGNDVIDAGLKLLSHVNLDFDYSYAEAGYDCYLKNGTSIPQKTIEACRDADATFFGAVSSPPDIPDYKSAIVTLRKELDLFVNVRPIKSLPVEISRPNIDIVMMRENTEGMYKGIEREENGVAIAERHISEKASRRLAEFTYKYARENNRKKVTVVHKANVLRKTCGLFRRTVLSVSENFPDIETEEVIVDAMAMRLIKEAERFDVVVTTNLFGDILSDEASQLVGGLGIAPSGNIGEKKGLFEPVHGSAPKYAGKDIANPTATFLSAAMMLDFLGEKKEGDRIRNSIFKTFDEGKRTKDLGGNLGTLAFTEAVINNLE
ncbi:MAG: isocitrate/isopropylmalate dehydrogenase family protein [Methanofastidiosum sp.]|jgi:isopropylmalate/isohomocitrate dehydrogenase-like protein|nr:isocitrate/isopropylmalate dehydrogenase family protein [Methanofastidiosum sp.]HNR44546.1 isocitrate/isopropylmalate dehydrogenase family protein [Methanofastidiosum sp.]HNU62360.1 isocitrate/isopropylmalate dehydrogenase family protein [Methanofastidiosum sp.]